MSDNPPGRISRRFAALASGRKGLSVGFWGLPGIGKSHSAARVLAHLPFPHYRLHATATPQSWQRVLPQPQTLPVWVERSLERLNKGEHLSPEVLAGALVGWLGALAPTVLYLEDLHEATPEAQRLWQAVAAQILRERSVGLLLTSRAVPPEPVESVALEPLNQEQSAELLRAEVGVALPDEAQAWIFERALGNPLFTLEYFRYLARLGYLWSDGRRWHWRKPQEEGLPTVVEALIAHHLEGVGQNTPQRQALAAKAVLPHGSTPEVWAEVANLSPAALVEAGHRLNALGVLRGDGFAHPLFREVFLRELSAAERHVASSRALALFDDQPLLAAQFVQFGAQSSAEAVERLRRAAQAAGVDTVQAAKFLAQAVDFVSGSEKAELALEAARLLSTHSLPEAVRLAELAYAQQPPSPEAALTLCELYFAQGKVSESDTIFTILPKAVQQSERGLIQKMNRLIHADDSAGVNEIWKQHQGTLAGSVTAIQIVVNALRAIGDREGATALVEEVLQQDQLGPAQKAQLYHARGNVHAMNAEFQQAIDDYTVALELYGDSNPKAMISILTNRAMMHSELSQYQVAIESLQQALQLATELGDGQRRAKYLQNLGYIYSSMREFEQAEAALLEAREELARFGVQDILVYAEANLSDIYREWEVAYSGPRAIRHGRAAVEGARRTGDAFMLCYATTVAAQAEAIHGDPQAALALAEEARQAAESVKHTLGVATALQARGRALKALGRREEAVATLREAVGQFVALGMEVYAQPLLRQAEQLEAGENPVAVQPSPPAVQAGLPLEVLGGLTLGGKPVQAVKLQELLAVLLEARLQGRGEVSSLELFDTLYPDTPEPEAKRALQQLVYRLRQSYGPAVVLTTPAGYALGEIKSDAEEFLRTGDTRLWCGAYLEHLEFSSDTSVRGKLYRRLFAAVEETLPLDPEEAARAAQILYGSDVYSLETLTLLLKSLQATADVPRLQKTYQGVKAIFAEVGEQLPEDYLELLNSDL